ncbi:MAG: hypothetical protein FJ207_11525 [Gemmatimonadetes bacterium]|nr:hypothetical protein [Gemmatimonadota bacterium]
MRAFPILAAAFLVGPLATSAQQPRINATDPQPSCTMCQGAFIPLSEIEAYTEKAINEDLTDQQVRAHDIGKAHVGIGLVYRGRLEGPRPNSVAEHDLVSEVYHVISGSATLMLGPDITQKERRPATMQTVREFNGPGHNGNEIRNGIEYNLRAGDVVIIPAGTGHLFTRIDDHVRYLMIRIDPDKVTPIKTAVQSRQYLAGTSR